MSNASDPNAFLGTGWNFPPTFRRGNMHGDNHAVMVSAEDDIKQSLGILLSTSLGERVMQPLFGCNLSDYQFEPMSSTLVGFVRDLVENAILYHEARIKTEGVTVTQLSSDDPLNGFLRIDVSYTIRTTNSRYNYVYDFYLLEGSSSAAFTPAG